MRGYARIAYTSMSANDARQCCNLVHFTSACESYSNPDSRLVGTGSTYKASSIHLLPIVSQTSQPQSTLLANPRVNQ